MWCVLAGGWGGFARATRHKDVLEIPSRLAPPAPAADLLGSAYRVITAVCEEEPPTAARLAEFYGKVVVCLHEAFSGQGFQLQRSLDAVLRNAKLKAPA